ncbi:MAG: MBL fold metallo-hydrolase [Bacteroidota bacterium]
MIKVIRLSLPTIPFAIAAHLIETADGPILLETGPHSTLSSLEKGLEMYGYKMQDIQHVFLTHIHLDHAGAAWAFAEHGATIYMHPFGKKHMVDPSKLYASAKMIYQDKMDMLWGQLNPIPETQIVTVENDDSFEIGGQKIVGWHTPGHAVHHIAYQIGQDLIAGDVAGVKIGDKGMIVPPCPPPDINLEDWMSSIQLIENLDIETIYLSHFGKVTDLVNHLTALKATLWDWANWMLPHYQANTPPQEVIPKFAKYVNQQLLNHSVPEKELIVYESSNPSSMSVFGLYRYWKKRGV